jgi:hypothetical protein
MRPDRRCCSCICLECTLRLRSCSQEPYADIRLRVLHESPCLIRSRCMCCAAYRPRAQQRRTHRGRRNSRNRIDESPCERMACQEFDFRCAVRVTCGSTCMDSNGGMHVLVFGARGGAGLCDRRGMPQRMIIQVGTQGGGASRVTSIPRVVCVEPSIRIFLSQARAVENEAVPRTVGPVLGAEQTCLCLCLWLTFLLINGDMVGIRTHTHPEEIRISSSLR